MKAKTGEQLRSVAMVRIALLSRVSLVFVATIYLSLVGCTKSETKKNSYASLPENHKKLADECMKRTNAGSDHLLITSMENDYAGTIRILLNIDQGSFYRCDFSLKTKAIIKAEAISGGEIIKTF